jgi:K+/H+ antiporter YhaU regulatory subunit KhtT
MSKDKQYSPYELWLQEMQLNKDGLNNLELLVQNWTEQAKFTPEEIQEETDILQALVRQVERVKKQHPALPTAIILQVIIQGLTNKIEKLKKEKE